MPAPPLITIVPIYLSGDHDLIRELAERVEQSLQMEAVVRTPWFDPELSFDGSRGQYNSTAFLEQLLSDPSEASRILGVTSVDLFIPVLSYVFGEAQLHGRAAVVSIHRLRSEAYGLLPDPPLLAQRIRKEALHELGHTFGLLHCLDPRCVMHASTYVEEIDLKSAEFCSSCLEGLRK